MELSKLKNIFYGKPAELLRFQEFMSLITSLYILKFVNLFISLTDILYETLTDILNETLTDILHETLTDFM